MPLEQVLALTEVNRKGAFFALGEVFVDIPLTGRSRPVTHVQLHIRVEQTLRGGSCVHTRLQRRERLHEPETARKAVPRAGGLGSRRELRGTGLDARGRRLRKGGLRRSRLHSPEALRAAAPRTFTLDAKPRGLHPPLQWHAHRVVCGLTLMGALGARGGLTKIVGRQSRDLRTPATRLQKLHTTPVHLDVTKRELMTASPQYRTKRQLVVLTFGRLPPDMSPEANAKTVPFDREAETAERDTLLGRLRRERRGAGREGHSHKQ